MHLATGQQPYHGLTQVQIISAMLKRRGPELPTTLPSWLQDVLKGCFAFDSVQRPSVSQLVQVGCLLPSQTLHHSGVIMHIGRHLLQRCACMRPYFTCKLQGKRKQATCHNLIVKFWCQWGLHFAMASLQYSMRDYEHFRLGMKCVAEQQI